MYRRGYFPSKRFPVQPLNDQRNLRACVSADDLKLILSAVGAYAHNREYRELIERLETKAANLGIVQMRKTK